MGKKKPRIFLSYSSRNRRFVKHLVDDLDRKRIVVWQDRREIKAGDSITDKIERGLRASDFLVIVLSKYSVKSKWVRKELEWAVKAWTKGKSTIIPVLREKCSIPYFLAGIKYANFTNKYKIGLEELLQGLSLEKKQKDLRSKHDKAETDRRWKIIQTASDSRGNLEKSKKEICERQKPRKKILIIGGGEISVEIGIAARETRRWDIRAIVDEEPSPIMYLPFYTERETIGFRVADFKTSGLKVNPDLFFQYLYLTELRSNDEEQMQNILRDMKEFIVLEKPDVVLLEDMFMTPQEWNDLVSITLEDIRLKDKKPIFMPSIAATAEKLQSNNNGYSDIFLNKATIKKFLCEIGLKTNVLGIEWEKEPEISVEDLQVNLKELLENEIENPGKQSEKIRKAIDRFKKVIVKPATTSSGHGQFILSKKSKLTKKLLTKQMRIAEEKRTRNETYVIEPYLKEKVETCAIQATTEKNGCRCLLGIYYDKYDMEEFNKEGFQGQTRLLSSRTNVKQNVPEGIAQLLIRRIPEIVDVISENLLAPFIYVEFFISNPKLRSKKSPSIFVNEISYRPDDAGFITRISHDIDQFSLFIESLERFLDNPARSKDEAIRLEPSDDWVCKTLILCEEFTINEAKTKYTTNIGPHQHHFQFKFYKKIAGGKKYRRIIGYQWHHKTEEDKDGGKHILSMYKDDLGLSPRALRQLTEFLAMIRKKMADKKTR